MATILSVARSGQHLFSKRVHPSIRLLTGRGVEGDAHCGELVQHLYLKRRDPTQPNLAQVHLFAAEMLAELARKGFPLQPGDMGENILTQDLELLTLPRATLLHLGPEAVVQITGLRTPCGKIDGLHPGLQAHLWGERDATGKRTRRAGVMGIVRTGGEVIAGADVGVELPPEPHLPLGPV